MFKFTTQSDPMYDEDKSIDSDSESEFKDIMVLKYGGVSIRVKCCEMYENAKEKLENILNGIDSTVSWEDGNGSEPSVTLKDNMFNFSIGHSCDYPTGIVELNINYEENKTEIDKFLNYLLDNYCNDQ